MSTLSAGTTWLVCRHPAALAWLAARGVVGTALAHVDQSWRPAHGDAVVGVLPLRLIAQVIGAGARYWQLELPLQAGQRGRELSLAELESMPVRLVEYRVAARVHSGPHAAIDRCNAAQPGIGCAQLRTKASSPASVAP